MKARVALFIHFTLILALALVGISPACHFIGGKSSLMEICGADGSVKTIALPDALNPFADDTKPPASDTHKQKDPCAFCFANNHLKITTPDALTLLAFMMILAALYQAWQERRAQQFARTALSARAPPLAH